MSVAAARADLPDQPEAGEITEFRAGAVRTVLLTLPGVAFAIVIAFLIDYGGTAMGLGALIPALTVLSVVGYSLVSRSPIRAALFTIAGLLSCLSLAIWISRSILLAALFCLVVIAASAMLGNRGGIVVAFLASALISFGWRVGIIQSDIALISITLVIGNAFLCWVATSPTYVALGWAWQSYDRSREVTDRLRDRQGELGRVVKSLNEAYVRLEKLNDELTRARQVADEARKLKAEFASNISHELRTPLNLIIGFGEMMATSPDAYDGQVLPPIYRRDLDAVLRNARHLSSLIDDVLDLSQIEASRMGLVKENSALFEIVGDATAAVSRLIDAKGLSLIVNVPDDLPLLYVDRTRIRQVLINLLSNAARFTDEGEITISASANETDIVVELADTGIGIATKDIPKVFEEFRQLDGSLKRRVGGSGLGLAISKQFVELHGGSVWVESEVGKGAVFRFSLPFAVNIIAATREGDRRLWDRVRASHESLPPEVMVVSPDPSVPRIFQRHLDGYRVTSYSSLASLGLAVDATSDQRCACVVVASDVESAWQEAGAALPASSRMPIIACSLPGRRDLARELGAEAYFVKPVSREDIVGTLRQIGKPLKNILVVDDEPDMLRLLGQWASSAYRKSQVLLADNGDRALEILLNQQPDAVLLDLLMQGTNGYSILQFMQADDRLRTVPVIVVTARGQQDETITASKLSISRQGGLTVGELMGCLRAGLDALHLAADKADQGSSASRDE